MSERITALQEGRAHEVYDIKVTRCLWGQLFREVFILFGLLVYSICHSLCTHLQYVYTPISLYGELASFSSSSQYSLQLAGPLGSHR